jgi:hypothetical protein
LIRINQSLQKYGWKTLVSSGYNPGTSVENGEIGHPVGSGSPVQVPYTKDIYDFNHYNHIHMQGFRPSVTRNPKQ